MARRRQQQVIPTVEGVLQDCHKLSVSELRLLREALDVLIERKELKELALEDKAHPNEEGNSRTAQRARSGYIEEKMIRGFGPYLYLRVRQNGVHHSFYLGKAESPNSD
jgi:hypothetical protein